MFLSLQKIIFTAAVIFAVWYGWRWVGRKRAEGLARATARDRRKRGKTKTSGGNHGGENVVDLAACPVCGDFVAPDGALSCERPDCPYRK